MSDFESRARKAAGAVRHQMAENTSAHETGIRRAQRSPNRVALPTAVAASVLIGAVIVAFPPGGGGGGGGSSTRGGGAVAMAGTLQPFDTCETVLQYFKDRAPAYLMERAGDGRRQSAEAGAADSAGAPAATTKSAPAYSKTNVQEAGIDEPDIVKTDGKRIIAVAQDRDPVTLLAA